MKDMVKDNQRRPRKPMDVSRRFPFPFPTPTPTGIDVVHSGSSVRVASDHELLGAVQHHGRSHGGQQQVVQKERAGLYAAQLVQVLVPVESGRVFINSTRQRYAHGVEEDTESIDLNPNDCCIMKSTTLST